MKAESRMAFDQEGVMYEEAECPNCGQWIEVTAEQAIGKQQFQCLHCQWQGYVGREAA